jgi:hypothetical protein
MLSRTSRNAISVRIGTLGATTRPNTRWLVAQLEWLGRTVQLDPVA